ncbi:hypothetical protein J1614_002916 [Plenodomus biglobosus]|nr:hypothetical protein J1614_002916 [Plenodomus biglobosus]
MLQQSIELGMVSKTACTMRMYHDTPPVDSATSNISITWVLAQSTNEQAVSSLTWQRWLYCVPQYKAIRSEV